MESKHRRFTHYFAFALIALSPNLALGQAAEKIPRIGLLMWSPCEGSAWTWQAEFDPFVSRIRGDGGTSDACSMRRVA